MSGNSTNNNLINITWAGTEIIDNVNISSYNRKFYLSSSSNINNTNITITNSSGNVIYSALVNGSIPTQTLRSYINNGGTRTNYSNYSITASASGYVTNTTLINLTSNANVVFNLNENIAPFLIILSPFNQSYSASRTDFNISANEALSWCGLSLDSEANQTMTLNSSSTGAGYINLSMTEGSHNAVISCNDSAGNINLTSVTFFIDSTTPIISIIFPVNTTYLTNVSTLNYTFTETNPDKCWWNNGTANSTSVNAGTNFTGLTSNEGSNTWIVYCNDTVGNLNSSSVTFFKDTIVPNVTINSPTPSQVFITASVSLNVTLNENGTCLYSTDSGATNNSMDTLDNLTFTKTAILNEGSHAVVFYCNDSVGNRNDSEPVTFSISLPNSNTNEASSGVGGAPAYYPTAEKLARGYEIALATDFQTKFNIGGNLHILKINSLAGDTVNITISSEPVTFILQAGQTQKVDINSDGIYDLSVFLKSISGGRANLVITSISKAYGQNNERSTNKSSAGTGNEAESPTEPIQNNLRSNILFYSITAVGIIMLTLVAWGIFLWVLKKRQLAQPIVPLSAVSRKLFGVRQ